MSKSNNRDAFEVENVSGARSASTMPVPRPSTASATPHAEPPGRRAPVEIDATTGQAFGASTAARAEQVFGHAVGQLGDPGQRQYLRNLFGLDAGRDRA